MQPAKPESQHSFTKKTSTTDELDISPEPIAYIAWTCGESLGTLR